MKRLVHRKKYHGLCEMLSAARRAAGIRQAELAGRLGRPQSYVSKYESGERRLDLVEWLEVISVLQVDAASFIHELLQKWTREEGTEDEACSVRDVDQSGNLPGE